MIAIANQDFIVGHDAHIVFRTGHADECSTAAVYDPMQAVEQFAKSIDSCRIPDAWARLEHEDVLIAAWHKPAHPADDFTRWFVTDQIKYALMNHLDGAQIAWIEMSMDGAWRRAAEDLDADG